MSAALPERQLPSRASLPTGDDLRDSSAVLLAQAAELTDALPQAPALDVQEQVSRALAPVATGSRLVALDAARVLATLGVMWTHVAEIQGHDSPTNALGRFGTSFYVAAAVMLSTRGAMKRPDTPFWTGFVGRAKRLLLPFLLWSAIYTAYYASIAIPRGATIPELTVWWGPFAGCARHLWFLPFAFFAGTVATAVSPYLQRLSTRTLALGTIAVSGFVYWYCHEVLFFALDRIWAIKWHLHRMDRWIEEIPLVILSIGLAHLFLRREVVPTSNKSRPDTLPPVSGVRARTQKTESEPGRWQRIGGTTGILLAIFGLAQLTYFYGYEALSSFSHSEARYVANAAGVALLFAFLLARPRRWMEYFGGLGRFTYFAFLAHVLLIDWGNHKLARLDGYGGLEFAVLSTALLFSVAIAVGAVVRKVPALRWLQP